MDRLVGTGPGEITPDGCAVEFYALLPAMGEPEIVHDAVQLDRYVARAISDRVTQWTNGIRSDDLTLIVAALK